MCGIAGIVSPHPLAPAHLERLARLNEALRHRGPDGEGRYETEHMAFAMRRLSIIDVAGGGQPLYDEDRSLVIVANGEIYNYVELRDQLRSRGHVFRTGSDIECILHLYQERGEDCVHELRGMFAFALWDTRKKTLLLARDRMGEKPLYLAEREGVVTFASELKALMETGAVPFELDPIAVDRYFHYQYLPDPMTPVRGVRKLPAGHVLTIRVDPWSVCQRQYWRMEDAPPLEGDPVQRIRAELETVSELVIRSDVPVGIALSGGLDSSSVAVLASRRYPGTMHAFSAGYSGRTHSDERSDARQFAEHLGMPFHEVEIETASIVDSFPDMIRWQDDPFADLSSFGYWSIARAARDQGVPVLMQGQGGDELFWGYNWVTESVRLSQRKSSSNSTRVPRFQEYLELSWPQAWPRRAPFDWAHSLGGLRSSWERYRRDLVSPHDQLVFYDNTPNYRMAEKRVLDAYQPGQKAAVAGSSPAEIFTIPRPWPALDVAITGLICRTYLLENGMARGDRLSMASSVELRLPLVDYRLVETVIGLRKTQTDVHLPPKTWLRKAVEDLLPDWVRSRRKRGFQPPVRAWHRAIFDRYGRHLEDGSLVQLGILQPAVARDLAKGPYPLTEVEAFSFTALALEMWCRQWAGRPVYQ